MICPLSNITVSPLNPIELVPDAVLAAIAGCDNRELITILTWKALSGIQHGTHTPALINQYRTPWRCHSQTITLETEYTNLDN